MKRHFATLFALTFLVTAMACGAEETIPQGEAAETEITATQAELTQEGWVAPFEDGEWLGVPELNAEVYMPVGWSVTEVTENGFTAADAEDTASLSVTLEALAEEEIAESDDVSLSAFETYLMGLGEEYELAVMADRETAIVNGEESLTVMFPMKNWVVRMEFAPADEGGIADSALTIAETFYIYDDAVEQAESEEAESTAQE